MNEIELLLQEVERILGTWNSYVKDDISIAVSFTGAEWSKFRNLLDGARTVQPAPAPEAVALPSPVIDGGDTQPAVTPAPADLVPTLNEVVTPDTSQPV